MAEPQLAENVLNDERKNSSFFVACLRCLRTPRQHQFRFVAHSFDQILSSIPWKVLIFVSTIVLLFGSPIQFLWLPKSWDDYLDIVYLLALVVFVFDMILNMVVDTDYLGFYRFHRNTAQPYDQAKRYGFSLGSFKMWCDVISTAALLYDISFTNPSLHREELVELELDEWGLKVS